MARICWFLLMSVCLVSNNTFAQCPDNIGFESGSLNNWVAYSGKISQGGIITVTQTPPLGDRHTIMKASDNFKDYYGDFPTVSPNGSKYSVRLGNEDVRSEVDRLTYTITVPAVQQYSLILNYAIVMQSNNHTAVDQPRFTVTVFNITDNQYVACPAFDFVASPNLPGFKKSEIIPPFNSSADVFYKDWSATTIDLSDYAGKQIRLEFTTNDCIPGGDFGYAYFDLNEECSELVTGSTYCEGQNTVNLVGPKGFQSYTWYNEDLSQEIGQGQTISFNPPPADGTKYALVVTTLPGWGCNDTLQITVRKSPSPFSFVLKDDIIRFCKGGSADLTAASVTQGSSPGLKFKYYKDPLTLEYLRNPEKVTEPGTYYIEASNNEGCLNMLPVEVQLFEEVSIEITDPPAVQYPGKINLATTFTHHIRYTYNYYRDSKATQPLSDHENVGVSGRYFVKAINASGCEVTVPVNVVVTPPAKYVVSVPNAFTPNGDGVNDILEITLNGFVAVNEVTVYSRNGQLVFRTNNINNKWDGRFNGQYLPAGTYYWLLKGTDLYYNTSVTHSGYVSIIK